MDNYELVEPTLMCEIKQCVEDLCMKVLSELESDWNLHNCDASQTSQSSSSVQYSSETMENTSALANQYFCIINEANEKQLDRLSPVVSDQTEIETPVVDYVETSDETPETQSRFHFGSPLSHCKVAESKGFEQENFFKGCKWSPDGLCFLTNSNDNQIRIFNTPFQLLNDLSSVSEIINLDPCLKIQEPETVYDYSWWPLMNSQEPATCCFATTSRDQPIHLWDAFDGHLRASYIALNSVYELNPAYCICFSNDGQQLIAGMKKEICVFYTDRPGSSYEKWSTVKKKQRNCQKNIISCVDFGPDNSMFACGSYDGTVGIYSPINGHLLDFTVAHKTGVTHIKFSADGNRLYTGARKGHLLKCWDIRNVRQPVFEMKRLVSTNQRIYFDLVNEHDRSHETTLASGSTTGFVSLWDLSTLVNDIYEEATGESHCADIKTPSYTFQAHEDCVNGCGFHPYLPLIVTSSGQRNFPEPLGSDDESNELFSKHVKEENVVKLWHIFNYPDEIL